MNVRALAARAVADVFAGRSLSDGLRSEGLSGRDTGLLRELVYGSVRHHRRLAALRDALLSQPLKTPNAALGSLMVVGLYQLLYTRVPAHAAVGETVNACAELKEDRARGLVNAVLRRAQREADALLKTIDCDPALLHSHPDWLVRQLGEAAGERLPDWLAANNNQGPMCLRVNRRQQTRDQYWQQLTAAGLLATVHPLARDALVLNQPCDVSQLPGFADGAVSVQDIAAQLAADFLDLQPGLRVLDACAAPGGKTAHMLEREPTLQVLALDNDSKRLQRVRDTLQRLKLDAVLRAADAGKPDSWWDRQRFDRILLDAPCSGTGVIRRHPDIKWLRRDTDIPALARTQLQLLDALWPTLQPGGLLLYCTCSVLPAENDQVIRAFLGKTADAQAEPIPPMPGDRGPGWAIAAGEQGMDGFFYARLRKQSAG